jgi:hypothetical protein
VKIGNHEVHPAAEKISRYDELRFRMLVDDIRDKGLLVPIVLYQGKILDGRHRYRACIEAGVEPRFEVRGEADPYGDVASYNLFRRHSDGGQRALDARRLVRGKADHDKQMRLLGVSDDCAEMADIVVEAAVSEVVDAVERGDVPLSVAAAIARQDPERQAEMVERYQAAQAQPDPVRARSTDNTVTSRAVELNAKSIAALTAALVVLDRSVHAEVREAGNVVRLLVPEAG